MKRSTLTKFIVYILISLLGLIMLYPLIWMIFAALKPSSEVLSSPDLLPSQFRFDNFAAGWKLVRPYTFGKFFMNTFFVVISCVVCSLVISLFVGYAFARVDFRFKSFWFSVLFLTIMLPATTTLVSRYVVFSKIGWLNTYLPFIIPTALGVGNGGGFFIYLVAQFIKGIPKELDEAAKIDGCGHVSAFTKIMLPIAKPGIVVAAVFSFVYAWGDLIYGITFITNPNMRPITSSIYNYVQQYQTLWNSTMAFGIIAITPVVLIFIFMQKYIVSGLTNGAVKA